VCDPSFWRGMFGSHLLYTDDIIVYLLEGHSDVLCRIIAIQMSDNIFNKFIHLCVKCKVEILLSDEFSYDVVVHHTFSCDPGLGCSVLEEELSAHDTF
jgi:hypothetical protein